MKFPKFIKYFFRPHLKGVIINHDTQYIKQLKKLFKCDVISYKDFNANEIEKYDYVILSGGSINISQDSDLVEEKEWIKNTNKPILGICLGLQILCIIYDKELKYNKLDKTRRMNDLIFVENDICEIFYNHDYYFSGIPKNFDGLMVDDILIYMKHKTKTILAFQGHPEVSECGKKVRSVFFNMIK